MSARETYLPNPVIGKIGEPVKRSAETSIVGCLNKLIDPDGAYESEFQVLVDAFRAGTLDPVSLEFDPEMISRWEYNTGRNYRYDILPRIVGLSTREEVAEKARLTQQENERKDKEIQERGSALMPCGDRVLSPMLSRSHGVWQVVCTHCGGRYRVAELTVIYNNKKQQVKFRDVIEK